MDLHQLIDSFFSFGDFLFEINHDYLILFLDLLFSW